MNTSLEDCESRLRNRDVRDRIEQKGIGFHRTVSERYSALLHDEDNVYQFDGDGDIQGIHKTIVDKTLLLLGIAQGSGE
jgi:thymidylate kinase